MILKQRTARIIKLKGNNAKSFKIGTKAHYTSKYNILEVLSIDRGKLNEREWVIRLIAYFKKICDPLQVFKFLKPHLYGKFTLFYCNL